MADNRPNYTERIREMEDLYRIRPYSDAEMSDRFGCSRGTIFRARQKMIEVMHIPIEEKIDERGQYYIAQDYAITHLRLKREEAATLYLAARRMQQQTKTNQAHVVHALEKLSHALDKPLAAEIIQAADIILEQEQDHQQEDVFTKLVECWLTGVPARITHAVLHGKLREYRVYPYQLEPSVWGDGIYLIGYSEHHQRLATFKLARIKKVILGTGRYEIPDDFDVHKLLDHAWGIWHADQEPVTVRLRFNKWVTPRVMETIWHPQQSVSHQDDGGSIWQVQVAEWKEMVPWIRGWGSDVEVLGPEELRDEIMQEVRRLMKTYQVPGLTEPPHYQLLWAKTTRDKRFTHPLICHLIDVGQVALALWNHVLTDGFRLQMAKAVGLDIEACGRALAFWVALHDLGKACPGFQRKYAPGEKTLREVGICFPKQLSQEPCYHATITTLTLDQLLCDETTIPVKLARKIAQALGGHHGSWPTDREVASVKQDMIGEEQWDALRRELVCVLFDLFAPPVVNDFTKDVTVANTFLTLFSGLTTVADWIGSMEEHFLYDQAPVDCQKYAMLAAQRAEKALQKLGWIGSRHVEEILDFEELFPFSPNILQQEIIKLAPQLSQPSIVFVEDSTGSGKTEVAFYQANYWLHHLQQRGIYIGMPTMATSNQMHTRATQFLGKRYPQLAIEPLLVHSQARWQVDSPPPAITTVESSLNESATQDMSWFLPRKRSLLAPFAVGTVDQALLSTLQTRHFFVRLFALSHKTIIFDEIHAYDTYMSTLFQKLLGWLRAVGASVILLSATLPKEMRGQLLTAYSGIDHSALPEVKYPAITWATADQAGSVPIDRADKSEPLYIEWIDRSVESIQATLTAALANGGCAAVICNTVDRAQTVYEALSQAQLVPDEDLILFHARYPFSWRDSIEKRVLDQFGKEGQRPYKSIVVATQVIEQSLDLDFDVMISDLAPIDLLLQRAGRLHRHPRDARPSGLSKPTLMIPLALDQDGCPDFGNDHYVYERYILLRSYLTLQGHSILYLPEEMARLIEAVYGETPDDEITSGMEATLVQAKEKMERQRQHDQLEAKKRMIPFVDNERLLRQRNPGLAEDDPEINQALQALTRLGPPTVAVVCLHETQLGLNTEPDGSGVEVDLNTEPDSIQTKSLAQSTLRVRQWALGNYFDQVGVQPKMWQDHPLLRDHYLIKFKNSVADLTEYGYILSLCHQLGLKIVKENL